MLITLVLCLLCLRGRWSSTLSLLLCWTWTGFRLKHRWWFILRFGTAGPHDLIFFLVSKNIIGVLQTDCLRGTSCLVHFYWANSVRVHLFVRHFNRWRLNYFYYRRVALGQTTLDGGRLLHLSVSLYGCHNLIVLLNNKIAGALFCCNAWCLLFKSRLPESHLIWSV